jgi:phosphohistidine swiveling domain-containing protein
MMRDRWITDWVPSERWPHYTRANSGEVCPTPASPLSVTYSWDNGICQGWRDGYVHTGNYAADEWDDAHPEACGFFGGYLYVNLANVRMQAVRSPALTVEQLDVAFFGDHPDVPPYVPHSDDERPDLLPGIGKHLEWLMTTTSWPEIDEERTQTEALRAERPDLATLGDTALLARAREIQPMIVKLFDSHTISSSSSGVAPAILAGIGAAIGDTTIPMKLLAGIGEVDSAEPSYRLWSLSRDVRASAELTAAFDAGPDGLLERLAATDSAKAATFLDAWRSFIAEFGARGPNEYEISAPTWETKPELALAALDRVRLQDDADGPAARHRLRVAEREAVTADVRARIADLGDDELAGTFEAALVAGHQVAFRERTKTNLIRAIHEARMVFAELGRRHAAAGHLAEAAHIYQLLDAELEAFVADPTAFRDVLAERAQEWAELWDLEPPFIIRDGNVPPLAAWPRRRAGAAVTAAAGDVIQGVSGCPGVVIGRARVVLDIGDPALLEPGDILVAPLTDPGWAPLFLAAGGVVVDVGGQISHAVIVSRELGLPCVISATDATSRIPDGARIEVDGDNGRVTVLAT